MNDLSLFRGAVLLVLILRMRSFQELNYHMRGKNIYLPLSWKFQDSGEMHPVDLRLVLIILIHTFSSLSYDYYCVACVASVNEDLVS